MSTRSIDGPNHPNRNNMNSYNQVKSINGKDIVGIALRAALFLATFGFSREYPRAALVGRVLLGIESVTWIQKRFFPKNNENNNNNHNANYNNNPYHNEDVQPRSSSSRFNLSISFQNLFSRTIHSPSSLLPWRRSNLNLMQGQGGRGKGRVEAPQSRQPGQVSGSPSDPRPYTPAPPTAVPSQPHVEAPKSRQPANRRFEAPPPPSTPPPATPGKQHVEASQSRGSASQSQWPSPSSSFGSGSSSTTTSNSNFGHAWGSTTATSSTASSDSKSSSKFNEARQSRN